MWKDLKVPPETLRLSMVLPTGQLFTWKETKSGTWMGVIRSLIVECKETPTTTKYRIINLDNPLNNKLSEEFIHSLVTHLFNLQVDTMHVIESFKDDRLVKLHEKYKGLRVLQQDPVECIFSFICSANNNIKRITKMIQSLKEEAGIPLGNGWYQFPELYKLANLKTETLRKLGFGFRASRIPHAAKQILDRGGVEWLHQLKKLPLEDCRNELIQLSGVGPKIADCICLYSLGFINCVPLDVHILRVSSKYVPKGINGYNNIQKQLEKRFGPYAGWAQCLLYLEQISK
ncbi:N-glycosylase/DNA lyase [Babesia microti strain RI]|uniref:DNA-(apurinic or apyrimidinic site) lyase n=1 Tax=Babesia microti (strain RI) TaxID=1133968 RepID=A0A1R4AAU5_BABMR|nr:N-glycosylase/DNA lyase [Babesia microti strain RI]SJK86107.1 N-glycosylase/DNA lyase [Babesia microti strain RI]|eukprot:XP_021338303.1 N-glycosylase/DNA lyase [Babesia microti strain RI]